MIAENCEQAVQTFRASWLRYYAVTTFWEGVALAPLALFLMLTEPTRSAECLRDVLPALPGLLLFQAAFSYWLAALYPVRVGTQGIYAFNFWGVRSGMDWDEIVSVKMVSLMGLPYLIVRSTRTTNALWLPLFFADNEAFRRAVVQFAPPNSPLLPSE